MITKAMLLAAGFGKRVYPLTTKIPKPLLKIGTETLLSNTLKFLKEFGIKKVVINVHYLGDQIINYISKKNFNLDISIIEEKEKILDTGGGVLNAIKHFSDDPFLVINPDTVWNFNYLEEVKLMEKIYFKDKKKCFLLLTKKENSFDKSFRGDFNLNDDIANKKNKSNLEYIYTGLQILKPEVFSRINEKVFSMNKIWDQLILSNELSGFKSNIDFLHVSTLEVYKSLKEKI